MLRGNERTGGDSKGKEAERTGVAVGGLDDSDSRRLMRLGDVGVVGREVGQFRVGLIGHCSEEARMKWFCCCY